MKSYRLTNDDDVGLLERMLAIWMEFRRKRQQHGMGGHAYNLISYTFNKKIKPRLKEPQDHGT